MALEKYKVCPACGTHNAPNLLECRKCEMDLTGVKIEYISTEEKQEKTPDATPSNELYRVCNCGEQNPPQARKCRNCGEDISDIIPTKYIAPEAKPFAYKLTSLNGDFSVSIEDVALVVGREASLSEYLSGRAYVSRQQAKLTIAAGKVFIENLSRTNKTFVNNEPIEDDKPFALKNGDEIGLGGKRIGDKYQDNAAYFIFGEET